MYDTSIILSFERQNSSMLSWSSSPDDDNKLLNLLVQWWNKRLKNYNGREHLHRTHFWLFLPFRKKYVKDGTAALASVYLYSGRYKPLLEWCCRFLPTPNQACLLILSYFHSHTMSVSPSQVIEESSNDSWAIFHFQLLLWSVWKLDEYHSAF